MYLMSQNYYFFGKLRFVIYICRQNFKVFMLFVSTPSLVISFVLAAFYVANLVFYVVNREQDTDNAVEITRVSHENQQTILLTVLQDKSDVIKQSCSADNSPILNSPFSILHYFCRFLPDITTFVFNSEIRWKLFSRPPPVNLANPVSSFAA